MNTNSKDMKRFLISFFVMALAATAMAQPSGGDSALLGIFNHVGIGVGAGTDGITAEVAAPIGGYVQIRAGYGFAKFDTQFRLARIAVPTEPGDGYENSPKVDVPLLICPGINTGRILVNAYPSPNSVFYFSAGVFAGSRNYANVKAVGLPEAYNDAGYEINGYIIKATDNTARAQFRQNTIKPYLGIGFGRPIGSRRCNVTFDLGVQYLGNAELWFWGNRKDGLGPDDWVKVERNDIDADFVHYYDDVNKYARFWPTVSIRVWFKAI